MSRVIRNFVSLAVLLTTVSIYESCKRPGASRIKAIATSRSLKTGMFMPLDASSALSSGKQYRITNHRLPIERKAEA